MAQQGRPSGEKGKSSATNRESAPCNQSRPITPVELSPSLGQSLPMLRLPIDEFRDRILQHIRENRVTHIQGETGCGKSTRLPQFILEDAKERGEEIRMVVTQPRRMAAVTLAKRVASVLGEEIGQGTVGYRISGDTINGKLCFVTVGYLLQRLVNNPEDYQRYTHVVLDEVHERGVDADLLSLVIKLLMHCCPTVKLVVMSATLQATLFADYFASLHPGRRPPEVLAVGARCHPVEQLFLDDLQQHFDFSDSKDRRSLENALQAFAGLSKGRGKGKGKKDGRGGDEASFKRVEPQISEGLLEVTCSLVQQLARPGCTIIVFLPGIADITQLFESLAPLDDVRSFGRPGVVRRSDCPRLRVFALHSMVPRQEQEEVFNEVPKDTGHVVLASNIAESSLTLPSVCAVVDLALRRTVQYDTRRLMCCLVTTWCSQSSCKQRRGRAGRTMPGRALCLVPRRFFESELPAFDPPEMLNAPLTKLYLQAKQLCSTLAKASDRVRLPPDVKMDISSPKALLNEVVQPPSLNLLDAAIQELSAVGCLTMPAEEAEITPLGQIAVALPCDLRICRLLFLGCLFGCPADALAMAAGLTGPDPFSTPSLLVLKDQKEYVQKLERSFASRRWCDHGTFSEPIMMHSLFKEWIRAGAPRGAKQLGSFVRDWSIIPKKFESLTADATELTVRFLKLLRAGRARSNLEELLAAMHHKVDKGDDLLRMTGWGNPERIFSSEVDKLRCLLALAFSDQMLLHLNPRWAPSSGGKKRLEEQAWGSPASALALPERTTRTVREAKALPRPKLGILSWWHTSTAHRVLVWFSILCLSLAAAAGRLLDEREVDGIGWFPVGFGADASCEEEEEEEEKEVPVLGDGYQIKYPKRFVSHVSLSDPLFQGDHLGGAAALIRDGVIGSNATTSAGTSVVRRTSAANRDPDMSNSPKQRGICSAALQLGGSLIDKCSADLGGTKVATEHVGTSRSMYDCALVLTRRLGCCTLAAGAVDSTGVDRMIVVLLRQIGSRYDQLGEAQYQFDHVFPEDTSQEEVFNVAVAPICEAVISGYNGAVIAYGQTGSGKTHTVVGTSKFRGVAPRAIHCIFDALAQRSLWSVDVSVLEIYNERVRDLLSPGAVTHVDVHEVRGDHEGASFRCPDAVRRQASSPEEALAALAEGMKRRETARTDMNHHSSRSHLIFTLTATQRDPEIGATLRGRLHLVDLAGSERLKRSMSTDFASPRGPTLTRRGSGSGPRAQRWRRPHLSSLT
ncbi:spn-E [Symbiodinium natans]|uniref:Spn-E protein n=1 Tax=Symbiodinium natans TaxID=878477 RepID=A0A812NUV7_9DINO|nr:spn-E [Symbiodinium natans]